jgi:hypothetical protein
MTPLRSSFLPLLAAVLLANPVSAQQTEGEQLLLKNRNESLRLARDASNPARPLVATDTIVPDVDDLADRFKRTQAKIKPELLAAYRPGPAHETLRSLGCNVLGATPMGAVVQGKELHMETLVYRCADGSQGRLTVSRNAPPDVQVGIDIAVAMSRIAGQPAVVRYFRADKSRRLVIIQSWMAGKDYLVNLEHALPTAKTDVEAGVTWAKPNEIALALDKAYAPR